MVILKPFMRSCAGFLFWVRSAALQINNRGEEQSKDTNQKCAPVCVSFLLATDRGLEKLVQDGAQACWIAWCASGTRMGNVRVMKGTPLYSAAASSKRG